MPIFDLSKCTDETIREVCELFNQAEQLALKHKAGVRLSWTFSGGNKMNMEMGIHKQRSKRKAQLEKEKAQQ